MRDLGSLPLEFWLPNAVALVVGLVFAGRLRGVDTAMQTVFFIPLLCVVAGEMFNHFLLTDEADWCSMSIGYVASISGHGGRIFQQVQVYLVAFFLSVTLSFILFLRQHGANVRALEPDIPTMQDVFTAMTTCAPVKSVKWSAGGIAEVSLELALLFVILFASLCGIFPSGGLGIYPPAGGTTLDVLAAYWHSLSVMIGIAALMLAMVGLLILHETRVKAKDTVSLVLMGAMFVYVAMSVTMYLDPSLLPPHLPVGPNNEDPEFRVCYNHLTKAACMALDYNSTIRDNWPCAWNDSPDPPDRPCTGLNQHVSETDPRPVCAAYGLVNERSVMWETHLMGASMLFAWGAMSYMLHYTKPGGAGFARLIEHALP